MSKASDKPFKVLGIYIMDKTKPLRRCHAANNHQRRTSSGKK
jgi:hypothetical protein